jgi:glycerol-3-phosphate O-acyltransferase/dihydroxyacetone phosphate acyltransferase
VARPQDKAKAGPGRIYFDKLKIIGEGTQFTKLAKGDKLRPAKSAGAYRIVQVISDTEGILGEDPGDGSPLTEQFCQGVGSWATYEIMGHVDQSGMFTAVHSALANGSCIGIFPEGGSHDNTDLLPLKVITTV